mgnify:CR=1 FL=1
MLRRYRFIPAGAGNTRQRPAQLPPRSVYPRWRGEHSVSRYISIPRNGLSPLARGTRIPDFSYGFTRRFIPAGAGNTRGVMAAAAAPPVYPRWRGEHWRGSRYVQIVRGLSPLARGTPHVVNIGGWNERFIPAGAGNTLNIYNCFLLQFSSSNNLPTWEQQFRFIKEHSTY